MTGRMANAIGLISLLFCWLTQFSSPVDAASNSPERWSLNLRSGEKIAAFVWAPAARSGRPRLAIVSHGVSMAAEVRAQFEPLAYEPLARTLNQLGYIVVLPVRPGYAGSSSAMIEDYGTCDDPNYPRAVNAIADIVAEVINTTIARGAAQSHGVVLVGHSGGGFGALAFAARNDPRVAGVVNLSGGLGGRSFGMPFQVCAPDRLVSLVGTLGVGTKAPSLWLYSDKDTYFSPSLSAAMATAYRNAGGRSEYILLRTVKPEGHAFIFDEADENAWKPYIIRFIKQLVASADRPLTRSGDRLN